jgi:hypothetical protein
MADDMVSFPFLCGGWQNEFYSGKPGEVCYRNVNGGSGGLLHREEDRVRAAAAALGKGRMGVDDVMIVLNEVHHMRGAALKVSPSAVRCWLHA